jgi:dipeptidyl-peptidase-4
MLDDLTCCYNSTKNVTLNNNYSMTNLRTKIIAFLLFIFIVELSYGQLTLDDIFINKKYQAKTAGNFSFLNTKPAYAALKTIKGIQSINIFNSNAQKMDSVSLNSIWIHSDGLIPKFQQVEISSTDAYFLLKANEERLYRNAATADYYITNGKNNISKISNYKISFPSFSADDKSLSYVIDNNLYLYNIEKQTELQITSDGIWNKIINGKSDWVYEEEFLLTKAFAWCANSTKIAYLKFNETDVKEYTFPYYYGQAYPSDFSYKYPKAGEQNSIVTAHYYDCKKKKNYKIDLSKFSYEYIPRIISANNAVYLMLLNRHQDTLKVVAYDFTTKQTKLVFTDVSEQYVDVPKSFYVMKDNSFITTSERDGYNHLYHFNEDGKLLKQLTKGKFEVTNTYKIDEKDKLVYYQSNESLNPDISYCKYLFSIQYETLEKKQLNYQSGTTNAQFSPDASIYLQDFSAVKIPPVYSIHDVQHNSSVVIENNQYLLDSLVPILPKKYVGGILTKAGILNTYDILPPDSIFYLSSKLPQPILFYVYGGPRHEEVENIWEQSQINFYLYYLAQQGIHIVCIDPRGSSGKGAEFKKSTHLKLGQLETEDLIEYATFLKGNDSINKSRIGIFGWSYGAYLSLLCLEQKNTPFKTAIAVAPVTNWKFYDNIYSERYLHTPQENPKGYELFNPIALAKNLTGKLLLIHGTADDNVHFQNSVELIEALNEAGKTYDLYLYPDKDHSISGGNTRFELFKRLTYFLMKNL